MTNLAENQGPAAQNHNKIKAKRKRCGIETKPHEQRGSQTRPTKDERGGWMGSNSRKTEAKPANKHKQKQTQTTSLFAKRKSELNEKQRQNKPREEKRGSQGRRERTHTTDFENDGHNAKRNERKPNKQRETRSKAEA
jgi:hypothetical protein